MPRFYHAGLFNPGLLQLDEQASKHCVQVLRLRAGDPIELLNGDGYTAQATIADAHKKHCTVQVLSHELHTNTGPRHIIALSLLKNTARFEWFLEKATELGISEIVPLLCTRTERQHFRQERMHSIVVSAMLQSRRYYLPLLHEPIPLATLVERSVATQKMIAHCMAGDKPPITQLLQTPAASRIVLIGPEGDFTADEVAAALAKGFQPVSLGHARLRTETAGIAAAVWLATN